MKYQCEACHKSISKFMFENGIRLVGIPLCFVDQAVRHEFDCINQRQADLFNKVLMTKYGVTREKIEEYKKLPYWQEYLKFKS